MTLTNWAGNVTFAPRSVHRPATVEEAQAIVARAPSIRALGTRHSFNPIADSAELIALTSIEGEIDIDATTRTALVPAGAPYGRVARFLHNNGWALHNLGSLPHISVAGACSTGTHGSGNGNGALATAVRGLEYITADGSIREVTPGDADFDGSIVALGALGVVVRIRLAIEPTFTITQSMYRDLPWDAFIENLDAVMASAYSVSVLGRWTRPTLDTLWMKIRDAESADRVDTWGATPLSPDAARADDDGPDNLTPLGVRRPWAETLAHFRFDREPSAAGDEIQTEYFVERAVAAQALTAVRALADQIDPVLLISEFRSVAADHLWMSPCYERDSLGIHFTWKKDPASVDGVLPRIEEALAPFQPRPHWGKHFAAPVDAAARYPRVSEFLDLVDRTDPDRKFDSPFLRRNLRGAQ